MNSIHLLMLMSVKFYTLSLQHINLSGNKVRSLKGLQEHDLLETIDLEDNEVQLNLAIMPLNICQDDMQLNLAIMPSA